MIKEEKKFKLITLPSFTNEKGSLTVLENILPFEVKRIYWIYGADGQTRGGHRHVKTCQALVAVHGTVEVYMNDGINQENILLDNPGLCLIVDPKDWHTMKFFDYSVLLVMASLPYHIEDYIDTPY